MDVSKLPKLSTTSAEPTAAPNLEPPPAASRSEAAAYPAPPPVGLGRMGEAWLSIGVGAIILLLNPRFFEWMFHRSTFSWTFNDAQGDPLPYPKTVFFWGDLALIAFATVLIIDGILIGWIANRAAVTAALGLTLLATLFNLGYVIYMMNGYGFQLLSGLAILFGGYIALSQWQQLKSLPRR